MLTDVDPEPGEQISAGDYLAEFLAEVMNNLWEFESRSENSWGYFLPGESSDAKRVQWGKIRFTDVNVYVIQFADQSVQLSFAICNPLNELEPVAHICWLYSFSSDDEGQPSTDEDPTLLFGVGPDAAAEELVLNNKALHRAISEFNDYTDQKLIGNLSRCIDVSDGGIEPREGATITTPMTNQSLRRFYFNFITRVATAA